MPSGDGPGWAVFLRKNKERVMAAKNIEIAEERKRRLKNLYYGRKANKEITVPFDKLYAWYESQEQKCCYCGITEAEIARLIDGGLLTTKRLSKRGRHLEIERKDPNVCYDNFNNLSLACYWCNNAKTDTFTAEEFKSIGKAISQIWKDRLKEV
jgi:hypothetical protein